MLRKLFGGAKLPAADPTAVPRTAPDTRIYAIGDIHGCASLLDALLDRIASDREGSDWPAAGRNVIVYLGDYVDRGLESAAVIERLISGPPEGFEAVHLMGNHEEAMVSFLEDISIGGMWLRNGGGETMLSYGVAMRSDTNDIKLRLEDAQAQMRAKLPQAHKDFLLNLPLFHSDGDYLFVHAGIRPGVALEDQHRNDLLWIREEFLGSQAALGHMVVHGHTIAPEPQERVNRIGIDTGAYATGVLTCLVLQGEERKFLQTGR